MSKVYDILGIGLGPFNLSLAALLDKHKNLNSRFLDNKPSFSWHSELMHSDSTMQTSYLKDLVTPVDPTSPYSFMNYLVKNDLFYGFMNTGRQNISRVEFEGYCSWVSKQLEQSIQFNSLVESVNRQGDLFVVKTGKEEFLSKNICIGSGPVKNIPPCARQWLGDRVFHAKSMEMKNANLEGKRVLIIGGGQTGVEILRNGLKEKWGRAESITLISGRDSLQPLDEGAFTNEFFSPGYVESFLRTSPHIKEDIVQKQLLTSDGNTPSYLSEFYNELYLDKNYHHSFCSYQIAPMRWLDHLEHQEGLYKATVLNEMFETSEQYKADIVILATGFRNSLPNYLRELYSEIQFDHNERPVINDNYSLSTKWDGEGKIYAMNLSRHHHGIADPQISLMAWRSANIVNDLSGKDSYQVLSKDSNLLKFTPNTREI